MAFDKTGTLTGSLVSMHARPDVRAVNAVVLASLIMSMMVHNNVVLIGLLYKATPMVASNSC